MPDAYIYDGVRTAFGRLGGALAGVRPDDLAAVVVRAILERFPVLELAAVGEVIFGLANGAGESGAASHSPLSPPSSTPIKDSARCQLITMPLADHLPQQ